MIDDMFKYFENQIKTIVNGTPGTKGLAAHAPKSGTSALHTLLASNPISAELASAIALLQTEKKFRENSIRGTVVDLKASAKSACNAYERILLRTIATKYHEMHKILHKDNADPEYKFPDYALIKMPKKPEPNPNGERYHAYNEVFAGVHKVREHDPSADIESQRAAGAEHVAPVLGTIFDSIKQQIDEARAIVEALYTTEGERLAQQTQDGWKEFLQETDEYFSKDTVLDRFRVYRQGAIKALDGPQEILKVVTKHFQDVHRGLNDRAKQTMAKFMIYQFIFREKPHGF